MIRSFGATDYTAVKRQWDPATRSYRFEISTSNALTRDMRRSERWYVGGWKIHLSIYPADYAKALLALKLFEERVAAMGLVYKYASSKKLYERFVGEVKGKFATVYCKSAADIPKVILLVNQMFTQEGITALNRSRIAQLPGLRHELPLVDGFGFVRYGAFCYTNGILDLTDADRQPMRDSRHRPFPRFTDPTRLEDEIDVFRDLMMPTP